MMEPEPDVSDLYPEDPDYEDGDEEDDETYGCCCPGRCLNPHWHHRLSECFTVEDVEDPLRWKRALWTLRDWLNALRRLIRRPDVAADDEDDLPF
jgi:hypothetical protein